jgi:hypothetical protein
MGYFIFICIVSLFVFYQNIHKNYALSKIFFYSFVFIVALFLGLRGNEDEYTRLYLIFPNLNDFFLDKNSIFLHEKGFIFAFIVAVLKSLKLNSQSLLFLFCLVSIFLNAKFFRKYSEYYFLAFLFYISHGLIFKEWSALRMGLASAMLLPMIYYLNHGNKFKFYLLAITATLIQYVAVFSFILIFLNRSFKKSFLVLGIFFAIILYYLNISGYIIEILISNNLLPSYASSYFINENIYIYDAGIDRIKTIQQIITVIFLTYFFGDNSLKNPKYYNLIFNSYYFGTLFLIIFSNYALLAFRIAGHFNCLEPILITYLVLVFRQRLLVANILTMVALVVAYLNYVILTKVEPYDFLINYIE